VSDVTYDPTQQMTVPVSQARTSTSATKPSVQQTEKQLIERILQLFPSYAFVFEEDAGGFGADLRDVLLRYAKDPNFSLDRLDLEIAQTRYAKETSDAAKLFDKQTKAERDSDVEIKLADILKSYGDAFTNPEDARKVALQAARFGYTGNKLKNFVYASVVKAGAGAQVAKTSEADRLRNLVKEYGYPVEDDEINAVLSGSPYKGQVYTEETLLGKAKSAAKGLYSHLSSQIDAGLSLDDIFKNYRAYASQILEIDPNQIDFTKDPKYARAFGNSKTGQMSLSDWVVELKSNDDYGYQFTNQARQQATNLVMEMEKAFGFRR